MNRPACEDLWKVRIRVADLQRYACSSATWRALGTLAPGACPPLIQIMGEYGMEPMNEDPYS
ncbi:hypothetical protein D9M68_1007960 [compost metagenome]